MLQTSWLHLDCSIRVFDCSIRVYQCIFELMPINAYSWLHEYEKCPGFGGSAGLAKIAPQIVTDSQGIYSKSNFCERMSMPQRRLRKLTLGKPTFY